MKYAVCNEMFGNMEFAKSLDLLAERGFSGVEIAPFTLFGDFSPAAVRSGIKIIKPALAASGIRFAGFHWLFVKPDGLRLVTADASECGRAWAHLGLLLDIAAELGGGMFVFGSPKQRASGGVPRTEALNRFRDGLCAAADHAEKTGSRILLEALPSADTDIVNTLREAAEIIAAAGKPGLGGMFDFHNTTDETDPWDVLLDRYWNIIHHVHINERDGSHPVLGGKSDFSPAFSLLRRKAFDGWVSLEIFTVPGDPVRVLRETRDFLKNWEVAL